MSTEEPEQDDQTILPFDDGSTGRVIRREWQDGCWFFSVVDVVAALTDSDRPRKYWSDLTAKRQHVEGFMELSEEIGQLKMRSTPGAGQQSWQACAGAI